MNTDYLAVLQEGGKGDGSWVDIGVGRPPTVGCYEQKWSLHVLLDTLSAERCWKNKASSECPQRVYIRPMHRVNGGIRPCCLGK
jgi:hypothetical protein